MYTCPATATQRNQRRDAITHRLFNHTASLQEKEEIADSALSHPDAHAGSVLIETRDPVLVVERSIITKGPIPHQTDPDDDTAPDADNNNRESNFNLSATHNVDAFADKLHRRKGHTDTQHNQIATRKAARKKFSSAKKDPPNRPHAQDDTPPAPANKRTKKIAGPKQHKWTLVGARELDKLYSTIGLTDMNVKGDGNCLLYAAMKLTAITQTTPNKPQEFVS
mmetsp:Transcript_45825/g.107050  ORF Transcript_45825/g.107050 Transcript_45825/m.107050 type:complete len:223 (-) Transcript_45825:517-1185(-)